MALFQNRPQVSDPVNYTTLGLNKTIMLVGLGNPGKEYELTRHNIGFLCLDHFAGRNSSFGPWVDKKDLKCHLTTGQMGDTRVLLVKPTTFMNLSGEAVQAVSAFYKIQPGSFMVVHDELDVDFGQVRLRQGGSSAGHNGIKSIIQHMGDDFGRIRIGVGPKTPTQIDSADFVLQKFSSEQQGHFGELFVETDAILSELAYGSPLGNETRSFLL